MMAMGVYGGGLTGFLGKKRGAAGDGLIIDQLKNYSQPWITGQQNVSVRWLVSVYLLDIIERALYWQSLSLSTALSLPRVMTVRAILAPTFSTRRMNM